MHLCRTPKSLWNGILQSILLIIYYVGFLSNFRKHATVSGPSPIAAYFSPIEKGFARQNDCDVGPAFRSSRMIASLNPLSSVRTHIVVALDLLEVTKPLIAAQSAFA